MKFDDKRYYIYNGHGIICSTGLLNGKLYQPDCHSWEQASVGVLKKDVNLLY